MWVASIQFQPLGHHHSGENGGIIINIQQALKSFNNVMIWEKRRSTRWIFIHSFFRHGTMVNDIINQLSWIGWMMWWVRFRVCVYTFYQLNQILFFNFHLIIGWWPTRYQTWPLTNSCHWLLIFEISVADL